MQLVRYFSVFGFAALIFGSSSIMAADVKIKVNGHETTISAFDISMVDKVPVPKTQKRPAYPASMMASGLTGEAVIAFVVSPDGDVVSTDVMRATRPEFGEAAMAAIRGWKFEPGLKNGRKVYTHMAVPIVFTKQSRGIR